MNAPRSTYDPLTRHVASNERVVWRSRPPARALAMNRLPALALVIVMSALPAFVFAMFAARALAASRAAFAFGAILNAGMALFVGVVLAFMLGAVWSLFREFLDSWSTTYALTDRRFLVVSERGRIEYLPPLFARMEAAGPRGGSILMFNWGPSGRRQREGFRDRLAGLNDAAQLQALITQTFAALEASRRRA